MTFVGILHHPHKPESQLLAAEIAAWLEAHDVEVWTGTGSDSPAVLGHIGESSLLIVIGGDGSTLQAARLAAPYQVPIFSIHMGRVGFLSEATPDVWRDKLTRVLNKEYWLERRFMLQARLERNGEEVASLTALNDIVVARGGQMRVLRMELYVDGAYVAAYTADALIAATPTGSTAYSMAAGGPLLAPELRNMIVLPVASHLSLDRALVLHADAVVCIQARVEHEAILTADGQDALPLQDGDRVTIMKNTHDGCFARVERSSYFYQRLVERLGPGKE